MKKVFWFLRVLSVLLLLNSQQTVSAQQTKGTSPAVFSLSQARSFFDAGMYEAVLALGHSKQFPTTFTDQLNDAEKEEWRYLELSSGIALNNAVAVQKAVLYFRTILHQDILVKLAAQLGHHYFLISNFAESLAYLEQTEDLYLNQSAQQRVQFEKAVAYFSLKKFDNASPYFKLIVQQNSVAYAADAKYYLGFIAFSDKQYKEALLLFQSLEKDSTYKTVVPFYLAYIYHVEGDLDRSIQFGERYLQTGDALHAGETKQLLASIYYNRKQYARAIEMYEQVNGKGVMLSDVQRFEWGAAYHATGKYGSAIELLKPLSVGNDAVAMQSMYVLGFAYLKLDDKTNARSALQYCLSKGLDPVNAISVRLLLAKLSLEMGFEDQAVQSLKDFLVDYSQSTEVQEAKDILLLFYARTNGFKQAIDLLSTTDRKLDIYQRLAPRILFGRGVELINELQYDKADQLMAEVAGFKSSVYAAPALFWRGEMSFRSEAYQKTVDFLSAYVKLKPVPLGEATPEHALYNLGYAHLALEEYASASVYLEKLYTSNNAIDGDLRREAAVKLADCAFMEKNLSKAKQLYSKISTTKGYGSDYAGFQLAVIEGIASPSAKINLLKKLEKEYPETEYMTLIAMELADTYMGEEQFEDAIAYLKQIASLVDKEDELVPASFLKWGICLYNMGLDDGAIAKYKEILQQYPSSEQASIALENSKAIFVEKGKINEYQQFLEAGGRSMAKLQKDSLFFQFVQTTYAEGKLPQSHEAISVYLQEFPEGLFVAEVIHYKATLYVNEKDWNNAAAQFVLLASKGATKYQEKALRQAGKIYFFELKEYSKSVENFKQLSALTQKPDVLLESLRGELRSYYHLKQWKEAFSTAEKMLSLSSANQDDLAYANTIFGYGYQAAQSFAQSILFFEAVVQNNNAALSAEASFQIALNYFVEGKMDLAEKSALQTIETAGSYVYWVTRSYLLLADLFIKQQDYFNARATLRSIVENSTIDELKEEARVTLASIEKADSGTIKK